MSNDNACSAWTSTGTSTSAGVSGLSSATTYYWHVRAVNASGATYANGSATAYWSFTTVMPPGSFGKISPANGATEISRTPTLSWATSTGADGYEFCYDASDDEACDGDWWSLGVSTSVPLSSLPAAATFYWQVRAVNAGGTTYANSGTWWSFTTVTPPGYFGKTSPEDGATEVSKNPTLMWGTSSGAVSYEYLLRQLGRQRVQRVDKRGKFDERRAGHAADRDHVVLAGAGGECERDDVREWKHVGGLELHDRTAGTGGVQQDLAGERICGRVEIPAADVGDQQRRDELRVLLRQLERQRVQRVDDRGKRHKRGSGRPVVRDDVLLARAGGERGRDDACERERHGLLELHDRAGAAGVLQEDTPGERGYRRAHEPDAEVGLERPHDELRGPATTRRTTTRAAHGRTRARTRAFS